MQQLAQLCEIWQQSPDIAHTEFEIGFKIDEEKDYQILFEKLKRMDKNRISKMEELHLEDKYYQGNIRVRAIKTVGGGATNNNHNLEEINIKHRIATVDFRLLNRKYDQIRASIKYEQPIIFQTSLTSPPTRHVLQHRYSFYTASNNIKIDMSHIILNNSLNHHEYRVEFECINNNSKLLQHLWYWLLEVQHDFTKPAVCDATNGKLRVVDPNNPKMYMDTLLVSIQKNITITTDWNWVKQELLNNKIVK